jgi:hypothetical protein
MRRLIAELLEGDHGCWSTTGTSVAELREAIARHYPDVLIVDDADFPRCCRAEYGAFAAERTIVIGHEPEPAYRAAAFTSGAGGWVVADAIGDELLAQLHTTLGCECHLT